MPQYAFVNLLFLVFKAVLSRKSAFRLFVRNLKVGREAAEVGITHDDTGIAAAVGRALAAVVLVFRLF